MRYFFFIVLFCLGSLQVDSQEFNIDVNINTPKLRDADPALFQTLENQVNDFLNNTRWTDKEYEPHERIEGNLLITIKEEMSSSSFLADFFFQSSRPVYNSSYQTTMLNYVDKDVPISYFINQPIRKSIDSYNDNLSSVLTFYIFVLLGFDYDSFSPMGGDPYFSIAKSVLNSIPSDIQSVDTNWHPTEKPRNRFTMIDDILNPRVKTMRQALYDYHRLSLDTMFENPDKGRAIMTSSMTAIEQVSDNLPNSMIVQMFSDSKSAEIIEIYKGASRGEKLKVKDIMLEIDPSRASLYNALN